MKKSTNSSNSTASADRHHEILIDGRSVTIAIRRSRRARRLALKLDRRRAGIELVLPWRTALGRGLSFAEAQADWIAARLADLPARVYLDDGAVVPFRGIEHRLRHLPGVPTGIRLEADEILISGTADDLARRLTSWLKRTARAALEVRARDYADQLDTEFHGLRVGDARTRWGSCSAAGRLTFSWRLILAPDWVLDYVVAHEVAHLVELNHGSRFWRLVEDLAPDRHNAQAWLKTNGARLQAVVAA